MKKVLMTALTSALLLSGCQMMPGMSNTTSHKAMMSADANALMRPASGSNVSGHVWVKNNGRGATLMVDIAGAPANGVHGFHIHEKGDCSAPDATSAGGHFNPAGQKHGSPNQVDSHAGDLPNLQADANGRIQQQVMSTLTADQMLGRALVIHAKADDYRSQPAGDSGSRVSCGVVTQGR